MITRQTASGLVLAEEAQDEQAITRALKHLDPQLTLQKERADVPGGWKYKVLLLDQEMRPLWQAWWADEYGNPLPLSSGIVDFVDRHRADARNKPAGADEHNARHLEQIRQLGDTLTGAVIDDHRAKVERGRVAVSLARHTRAPYWLRNTPALRELLKR